MEPQQCLNPGRNKGKILYPGVLGEHVPSKRVYHGWVKSCCVGIIHSG